MKFSVLFSSRSRSFSSSLRCSALDSSAASEMYVSMSPVVDVSLASAAIWSSERLRSRKTDCAAAWSLQKSGAEMRVSRVFSFSRCCAASKKTPNQRDARLQGFIAVLKVFEDHVRDESEIAPELLGDHVAAANLGAASTGIKSSSLATGPFQKVEANRIAETNTPSQTNQSPNRV